MRPQYKRSNLTQSRFFWILLSSVLIHSGVGMLTISHAGETERQTPAGLIKQFFDGRSWTKIIYYELVDEEKAYEANSNLEKFSSVHGYKFSRKRQLTPAKFLAQWKRTLKNPSVYRAEHCQAQKGNLILCGYSMCFNPGTAVEFVSKRQSVTFVICLNCSQMIIYAQSLKVQLLLTSTGKQQLCKLEKHSIGQCGN